MPWIGWLADGKKIEFAFFVVLIGMENTNVTVESIAASHEPAAASHEPIANSHESVTIPDEPVTASHAASLEEPGPSDVPSVSTGVEAASSQLATENDVKLVSGDGVEIVFLKLAIDRMYTIKSMIDDIESSESEIKIPLTNVLSRELQRIYEYVNHHIADPVFTEPDPDDPIDEISGWDLRFFTKIPPLELAPLMMAADFLNIPDLVEIIAQRYAELMDEKTPEEIREMFNIPNDLTPEDIAQIEKENYWAANN